MTNPMPLVVRKDRELHHAGMIGGMIHIKTTNQLSRDHDHQEVGLRKLPPIVCLLKPRLLHQKTCAFVHRQVSKTSFHFANRNYQFVNERSVLR